MLYQTEFKDFILGVEVPADFVDTSWHNDACPSFTKNLGNGLCAKVYVDYINVDDRETQGDGRFTACICSEDMTFVAEEVSTDDWNAILEWVATKSYIAKHEHSFTNNEQSEFDASDRACKADRFFG